MPNQPDPIRCFSGNAKPFEPFWKVRDAVDGGTPEIEFYGFISEYSWMGDEITPMKFKADLKRVGNGGPITVRINSGGGEIFAASAIRAILADYPGRVTARIDGLCASAAVAVALAADEIQIQDTAYMMVHNPGYALLVGYMNSEALLKFASELELFKEGLLNAYVTRTGLTREALSAMLDEETWMTAQDAVELGFANTVITGAKPVRQDQGLTSVLQAYTHVPPELWQAVNTVNAPLEAGSSDPAAAEETEREAQALRTHIQTILTKEIPHA